VGTTPVQIEVHRAACAETQLRRKARHLLGETGFAEPDPAERNRGPGRDPRLGSGPLGTDSGFARTGALQSSHRCMDFAMAAAGQPLAGSLGLGGVGVRASDWAGGFDRLGMGFALAQPTKTDGLGTVGCSLRSCRDRRDPAAYLFSPPPRSLGSHPVGVDRSSQQR